MCWGWGNHLWRSCKKLRCNSKTCSWGRADPLSPPGRHARYPGMGGRSRLVVQFQLCIFPLRWLHGSRQSQPRKTAAQQNVALPQVLRLCYTCLIVYPSPRHIPQTLASDRHTKHIKFKCINVTHDHNSWNAQRLQVVKIANKGTNYK